MVAPSSCVSVDMDSLWCYAAIHGLELEGYDPGQDPVWRLGMVRLLELFERCGVKATFFCVGRDLEQPAVAQLVRQAAAAGHEIANHSYAHPYNLRSGSPQEIEADLARAEALIEAACGRAPVGFRTPGYNLSASIVEILHRRGYQYDASVFSCPPYYGAKGAIMAMMRLRGQPSRSQMTLPWTLLAPLVPYRARLDQPWKAATPGLASLWEVPMAVVPAARFPLIGTSLHLIGAGGFGALMPWLRRTHRALFSLEFHGLDLIDRTDLGVPQSLAQRQPDLAVSVADKIDTFAAVFEHLHAGGYVHRRLDEAVRRLSTKT